MYVSDLCTVFRRPDRITTVNDTDRNDKDPDRTVFRHFIQDRVGPNRIVEDNRKQILEIKIVSNAEHVKCSKTALSSKISLITISYNRKAYLNTANIAYLGFMLLRTRNRTRTL